MAIEIRTASVDITFHHQCDLVFDVMSELTQLRHWCSGCPCHSAEERRATKDLECPYQGKVFRQLPDRLRDFSNKCRNEMQAPSEMSCCFNAGLSGIELVSRADAFG